jgi:hypothetical protein
MPYSMSEPAYSRLPEPLHVLKSFYRLQTTTGPSFTTRKTQNGHVAPMMYSYGHSPTSTDHPNPLHHLSVANQSSDQWLTDHHLAPPLKRRCTGNEDDRPNEIIVSAPVTLSQTATSFTPFASRNGGMWASPHIDFSHLTTNPGKSIDCFVDTQANLL